MYQNWTYLIEPCKNSFPGCKEYSNFKCGFPVLHVPLFCEFTYYYVLMKPSFISEKRFIWDYIIIISFHRNIHVLREMTWGSF